MEMSDYRLSVADFQCASTDRSGRRSEKTTRSASTRGDPCGSRCELPNRWPCAGPLVEQQAANTSVSRTAANVHESVHRRDYEPDRNNVEANGLHLRPHRAG